MVVLKFSEVVTFFHGVCSMYGEIRCNVLKFGVVIDI